MHFSTSTASAVLASLLVKEALAANHRHQRLHDKRVDVVVDDVVTETDVVWVTVSWAEDSSSAAASTSAAPVEPTTTASVHTTLTSSVVVPSSSVVVPSSSAAVFIESSSAAYVASTSSAAATSSADAAIKADVVQDESSSSSTVAAASTTLQTVAQSSSAAVASTTSSAATSTSTSSSSAQAGVPYNDASLADLFVDTSVTWAYNWGSSSDGLSDSLEYVPMLWCTSSTYTDSWTSDADAAIEAGSTYLLGFNEPDLDSQCDISYEDAATGWLSYMEPFAGKAKLVSPAVTNGDSPLGLTYLSNFIDACTDCTIDAVAIHWYDSASNVDYFTEHVTEAYIAGGNRSVWITEIGATGTDDEIVTFLDTVIPWMESSGMVERYAYFMAEDGVLTTTDALSTIGEAFADA